MLPTRAGGIFAAKLDRLVQVPGIDQVEPASCSFVSAKGPSVTDTLPLRTRTVVAVCTDCSASAAM